MDCRLFVARGNSYVGPSSRVNLEIERSAYVIQYNNLKSYLSDERCEHVSSLG